MMRKLEVVIVSLFIVATVALKANAQQTTRGSKPQSHGEAAELEQRIATLEQQAKPLYAQLAQIEAQAKPIREQIHAIQEKIKVDRARLRHLREEHREHRQEVEQSNQTRQPTSTAIPQQK